MRHSIPSANGLGAHLNVMGMDGSSRLRAVCKSWRDFNPTAGVFWPHVSISDVEFQSGMIGVFPHACLLGSLRTIDTCRHRSMDGFPDLSRLHGIKLSYQKSLVADMLKALIKDRNHRISVLAVDVAKPVVNLLVPDSGHHPLVCDTTWISLWVGITHITTVIHATMAWAVSDMHQHLKINLYM